MGFEDINTREVISWLATILTRSIDEISCEIVGTSEKGAGQCGEVIFVNVTVKDEHFKSYHLVLKCSNTSTALMAQSPIIKDAFTNEIYIYNKVFPTFKQFQLYRNSEDFFDSMPTCYGVYSDEVKQVIALEDLRKSGYTMWDNCKPLPRKHIDMVVKEYGKFHAISVAMQELQPEQFEKLAEGFVADNFKKIFGTPSTIMYLKNIVQELHALFKNDFDENMLRRILNFKDQIKFIFCDMHPDGDDLKVITHGDCWSNNFLFKNVGEDESMIPKVALLDWQMSRVSSPVTDLAYFLFECISDEDILSMDSILKIYHDSFSEHLEILGVNAGKYPLEDFLKEWKKFSKFGLIMSITLIKASYTRRKTMLQDKTDYKDRVKPVIRYALENGIM